MYENNLNLLIENINNMLNICCIFFTSQDLHQNCLVFFLNYLKIVQICYLCFLFLILFIFSFFIRFFIQSMYGLRLQPENSFIIINNIERSANHLSKKQHFSCRSSTRQNVVTVFLNLLEYAPCEICTI